MASITVYDKEKIDQLLAELSPEALAAHPAFTATFVGQYATVDRPDATEHSGKVLWDIDEGSFYESNGTTWEALAIGGGGGVDLVNGQTGVVVLNAADVSAVASADVIDEDDMASDSATKVPTQQSVKAYVDAMVATGVERTLSKLLAGEDVVVSFIGDSGLEGNTADTPGTDDAASLICADLAARFGVTVTKNNVANSGDRSYQGLVGTTKFADALTDQSDLVVIAYGHNDLGSEDQSTSPGTGYPYQSAAEAHEHMIRRLRRELPDADIIVCTSWPYASGSSSNAKLQTREALIDDVVEHYSDVASVDVYGAFTALGDWSSLLDGSHPNSAGHRVWADEVLALFPATSEAPATTARPPLPARLYATTGHYARLAWQQELVNDNTGAERAERWRLVGTWVGETTTTAGAYAEAMFIGPECALRMVTGAGQGVVDIYLDGDRIYSALDLATISSGTKYLPLVDLGPGLHHVIVECVSGEVTVDGVAWLRSNADFIGVEEADYTGTAPTTNLSNSAHGYDTRSLAGSDTVATVTFTGTGLSVEMVNGGNGRGLYATVDGGAEFLLSVDGLDKQNVYIGKEVVSGLDYGEHTVALRRQSATVPPALAGFHAYQATASP